MTRPALPELYGYVLAEERTPLDTGTLRLRRVIADHFGVPAACRRPDCRAAGACRSRDVACFDRRRAFVIDALTQFAAEGYVADDDLFDDDA